VTPTTPRRDDGHDRSPPAGGPVTRARRWAARALLRFARRLDGRDDDAGDRARLDTARRALESAADLGATAEAIAVAGREAVAATVVSVMRRDPTTGALATVAVTAPEDAGARPLRADPDGRARGVPAGRNPSDVAAATGQPVTVRDFSHDPRFAAWAGVAAHHGIGSMLAVPLATDDVTVGVVNAYWDTVAGPAAGDVDLLLAFGGSAARSLLRAEVFEDERRAAAGLREAERTRSEFTAVISHELRTPLTTVVGFLETLLAHEDRLTREDRRRMLEVSRRNAVDLSHRVAALLEFSKLEAEHATVEPHPQPLGPALATALDNCAGLLAEHELVVAVDGGLEVDVDEGALDHVVANLVGNAVKYAPSGTPVEISTTVAIDGAEVILSVRDHGPGIPAAELPHVFQRFYRGSDPSRRRGTGIGLAIVERYVTLGGGRVWVESPEGAGATVHFTVPLAVSLSVGGAPGLVPGVGPEMPGVDAVDHGVQARDELLGAAYLDEVGAGPS
jgi:signal transduction histidine kinase